MTEILIISFGLGLGAFIKGAIGFGLPMIATPIMLFVVPLPEVVALMLAPVFITNIQQCWLTRSHWQELFRFWPMILACLVVIIPGSRLLVTLDAVMLAGFVGALILGHAVLDSLPRPAIFTSPYAAVNPRHLLVPAGILSGLSGSLTSIYSFPTLQLMVSLRLPKEAFVFTIGIFLLCGYVGLWGGLAIAGYPSPAIAITGLWAIIPAVTGLLLGNAVRGKISPEQFIKLVNGALAIAGLSLIAKAVL